MRLAIVFSCLGLAVLQAAPFELTPELRAWLGESGSHPLVLRQSPAEPHTSFHTQTGYLPEFDLQTDAVIIYNTEKENYDSWQAHGYVTQTMYTFRMDDEYIRDHPDEGQTNAKGEIITVGGGQRNYMVPTEGRLKAAIAYFDKAIDNGSMAVVPEEPEFHAEAGYSESFKREWLQHYGEPWQDPASSIEARWKSDRLKAFMEHRMISGIFDAALAKKPEVKRILAIHSPLHYFGYGLIFPYHQTLADSALQEVIGQVWTGTARAPTLLEGVTAERTFEWGYLEYSSLVNFARDSGKRLWLFLDPLEDNPDRGLDDYQENYEKTLIASLMFPQVDEYEVMPWPTRIYGHVPDWFTTKIAAVVTMLNDMHLQQDHEFFTGTQGIATFVADSMGWQCGEPHPNDMTGFHGLTLPLITRGVPIQVAQLERSTEPDYLSAYKVLLLSYDHLKPMSPAYNEALAAWVKKGGTLILFGGSDPYNDLDEWWKKAGFRTPQDHLFAQLGLAVAEPKTIVDKMITQQLTSAADHLPATKFPSLSVPGAYAMTAFPTDQRSLYRLGDDQSSTPIFKASVARGHVITVGIAPPYFASSAEAAAFLRALVEYGCRQAGVAYQETGYLGIRRGKYFAFQSLGQPFPLTGFYVDVVGREMKLLKNPIVPVNGRCMYANVTNEVESAFPRILITSDRIQSRLEAPDITSLFLTGTLKTKGEVRLSTAGRRVESVTAVDARQQPLEVFSREDGGDVPTLFLRYDSLPQGVALKVVWQPGSITGKATQ